MKWSHVSACGLHLHRLLCAGVGLSIVMAGHREQGATNLARCSALALCFAPPAAHWPAPALPLAVRVPGTLFLPDPFLKRFLAPPLLPPLPP